MGVKQLWKALEESKVLVGMEHMRNKTVAVDTSGWLFQSERTGQLQGKQGIKPHLRNLFWRVHLLQRHHVKAVFILEGSSPAMKQATLEKRAEQSSKFYSQQEASEHSSQRTESPHGSPSDSCVAPSASESDQHHHGYSLRTRECCELLDCLGVPYVQAPGEAEATCALLNISGFVDSCITDDGDSFLFGARQIYKNFSKGAADGGSVEFYDMFDIEEKLNLNREKLVAMALLTGCDYDAEGVKGIGKEQSLKLFQDLPSDGALQRLRDWKNEDCDLNELEIEHEMIKKPNHCHKCNHLGSKTSHQSEGCGVCDRQKGCTPLKKGRDPQCHCPWHRHQEQYNTKALEIRIRKRALTNSHFPDEKIIKQFLDDLDPDPAWKDIIQWKRPDFLKLKEYISSSLGWDDAKIVCKTLPLLTAWDMEDMIKTLQKKSTTLDEVSRSSEAGSMTVSAESTSTPPESRSTPQRILHARTSKKVPVLDVQWKHIEGVPEELFRLSVPVSPTKADEGSPGVTEEDRRDVEAAFPWLVKFFDNERAPAKGKRKSSLKDPSSSKQLRVDKMFKVRKQLNFAAAGKDVAGTTSSRSQLVKTPKTIQDITRMVPDIDCQPTDICGCQKTAESKLNSKGECLTVKLD